MFIRKLRPGDRYDNQQKKRLEWFTILALAAGTQAAPISAIAGNEVGDGERALNARFSSPTSVAIDAQGNMFVADYRNFRIRKITVGSNIVSTYAGVGQGGGDWSEGIAATSSVVSYPNHVAMDAQGNLTYSLSYACTIRKVDATSNLVNSVAGSVNTCTYSGDGGLATAAGLGSIGGYAYDTQGNLYISDATTHRIRKVDASSGIITTIAGTGTAGYDASQTTAASSPLNKPAGIAIDPQGGIFFSDAGNNRVRHIDASGNLSDALSTGLYNPQGLAIDGNTLYIADSYNIRILAYNTIQHTVTVWAGNGNFPAPRTEPANNSVASAIAIGIPADLAIDGKGNLFFTDQSNHRIRKVDKDGRLWTTAGADWTYGDNGVATKAYLAGPSDVKVASDGSLIIADTENGRIRKVDTNGVISTLAGTYQDHSNFSGENAPAIEARLSEVLSIALDDQDNVYLADKSFKRIRQVDVATGLIHTAFTTTSQPVAVALDKQGYIYYTMANNLVATNQILRRSLAGGVEEILAGTGTAGYSGDNGQATAAKLNAPQGLSFDATGNLYFADLNNHCIRRIERSNGIITTVAGICANSGSDGDGGLATAARLNYPHAVTIDEAGNLYIADRNNNRIRKVDANTGIISTLAGTGNTGYSGNGGAATNADINFPKGLSVDKAGNVFITESYNNMVRMIGPMRQKIDFNLPPVRVYGEPASMLTISITSGQPVTIKSLTPDVCVAPNGLFTMVGAGICSIEVSQSGNSNWKATQTTRTDSVYRKFISLTNAGTTIADKTYDGNVDAKITAAIETNDLVNGDVVDVTGCTANFTDANAGENKEVFVKTCTLVGTKSTSYVFGAPAWSYRASIKPKTLDIIDLAAEDRYYDGSTHATLSEASLDPAQVIDGDNVSLIQGSAQFPAANAAINLNLSINGFQLSGTSAGNYTLASVPTLTASILPKPLVVKADSARIVWGDAIPPVSLRYKGLIDGEDESVLTSPVQWIRNTPTGPGSYLISVFGGTADNYALSYENGYLVISESPTALGTIQNKMPTKTWRRTFDLLGRNAP